MIKQDVLEVVGLTCSVGCAPNKPVAKIASAFQKPDGLTTVKPDGVIDFLSPLPVEKISGVGRKTEKHLNNLGIHTIGELADAAPDLIKSEFGEVGIRMKFLAKRVDEEDVKEREEIKIDRL